MFDNDISADMPMTPTAALSGEFTLPETGQNNERVQAQERLAFRVGALGVLIPSNAGREVVTPPPVSRLPHLPAWLAGVANVRGMLLPVVDMAHALGLARDQVSKSYLLIHGAGEDAIGLLVDGLPQPLSFEESERMHGLPPHPDMFTGHVRGAYKRGDMVWLDLNSASFVGALGELVAARN
jgi:chemotaxis signal transduction protein